MKCFALRMDGDLESLDLVANSRGGDVKLVVGCFVGSRLLCPSVPFVLVLAKTR